MKTSQDHIIGELVTQDYRTASVFKKYGIDFCCQGNRTINEACEKKNVDAKAVLNDLEQIIQEQGNNSPDYKSWPLDLLDWKFSMRHKWTSVIGVFLQQYSLPEPIHFFQMF